jgi:hypothetical protein
MFASLALAYPFYGCPLSLIGAIVCLIIFKRMGKQSNLVVNPCQNDNSQYRCHDNEHIHSKPKPVNICNDWIGKYSSILTCWKKLTTYGKGSGNKYNYEEDSNQQKNELPHNQPPRGEK